MVCLPPELSCFCLIIVQMCTVVEILQKRLIHFSRFFETFALEIARWYFENWAKNHQKCQNIEFYCGENATFWMIFNHCASTFFCPYCAKTWFGIQIISCSTLRILYPSYFPPERSQLKMHIKRMHLSPLSSLLSNIKCSIKVLLLSPCWKIIRKVSLLF